MEILTEIIGILVGGITGIADGIGKGLTALVSNIFLTAEGALSTFGTLVVVFAGISLAIGKFFLLPLSIVILIVYRRKKLEACKMVIRTEVVI